MTNQSWNRCNAWNDSMPQITGGPAWAADGKTCVVKVKLGPDKAGGRWLNSGSYQNFRDEAGRSAVPNLLVFSTGRRGHAGNDQDSMPMYAQQQLKLAQAGNYWAAFNLWKGYAKGAHEMTEDSAEAAKWLAELVKGTYLAKFEPVNGFNPRTPQEILTEFADQCHLFSGKDSLGGASFFRTTKQNGKLIGSFLTSTPDDFKAALKQAPNFRLISIIKLTPERFLAHEASPQKSL